MRRPRRSALLSGLVTLGLISAFAPAAAMACSCVGPEEIIKMLPTSPNAVAFTGSVGPAVPEGVPVSVTSWYGGPPPADTVALDVAQGSDGMCGRDAPPPGPTYLFVTWLNETGRLGLGLCDIAVDVASAEGQRYQEMLAAVIGPPTLVAVEPSPPPDDLGGVVVAAIGTIAPTALAILLGVLVVGGLFAWVSRREVD